MMRKITVFCLVFVLDVHVKAREVVTLLEETNLLQQPTNCLLESSVCAIHSNKNRRYKWQIGNNTVVLAGNTTVIRMTDHSVQLVDGTIWVLPKGEFVVESLFGTARSSGEEFWVIKRNDKVYVRATFAEVSVAPRGSHEKLQLLPGFENWLGPVQPNGHALSGVPTALPYMDHVFEWARLTWEPKRDFLLHTRTLRKYWWQALNDSIAIQQQVAERSIAMEEDRQRQLAQRRHQYERESQRLRQLFRQKNDLDF